MSSRRWVIGALVLLLGIAGLSQIRKGDAETSKRTESDAEAAAEKAVSVLPPGTEDAWLAYVDRRIAATLHRSGSVIQLTGGVNDIMGTTAYVSVNSPYGISCNVGDGDLTFGYGHASVTCPDGGEPEIDNDFTVAVYGDVTNADPSAERSPPLGVHKLSIAARNLDKSLCKRIAERLQEIMAPQQCGGQK